jgi:hypothetical protein
MCAEPKERRARKKAEGGGSLFAERQMPRPKGVATHVVGHKDKADVVGFQPAH